MPRRPRLHPGTRLFLVYAAVSLVPVTLLGLALIHGYQERGQAHAREQGLAEAQVIEQMAVAPALRGADLSVGLTPHQRSYLQSSTDLALFNGSVTSLQVLDFEGQVAFSDDGGSTSQVAVDDPGFQTALAGGTDLRISGRSVRVLQPVFPETSGQAVGVLEVYLPYSDILAKVQEETRTAVPRMLAGLLALYTVLAMISFLTTRALTRYAVEHERQALHDSLTGLPNRELFRRVASRALTRSARLGHRPGGALVVVDLDHFKEVNDTLGHHAGDELLQVVAQRLSDSLRSDDTVARLGGDEFGIILPSRDRADTVALLCEVRRALSEPVPVSGRILSVEASFGVCFFPDDADTVEGLLQHADAAMYQGKHGPQGVVVYEPGGSTPQVDALVLQGELRRALDHEQFVLLYQPKIDLATGRVTGVEALVRWQHPERGLLAPAEFLPVVERSELIVSLTRWVLGRALADLVAWTAVGHDWTVSVNVSAKNLASLSFAEEVIDLLDRSGVSPSRLCLEVTESAIAFDLETTAEVIAALSASGIAMALDDFGVGYTAISQLRALAMDEIKIDRLFITGLAELEQDRAIVGSVIDLAHSLGCTVTAEGVESAEVATWLGQAGCDHAQGYLWLRPVPWPVLAAYDQSGSALRTGQTHEHRPREVPA